MQVCTQPDIVPWAGSCVHARSLARTSVRTLPFSRCAARGSTQCSMACARCCMFETGAACAHVLVEPSRTAAGSDGGAQGGAAMACCGTRSARWCRPLRDLAVVRAMRFRVSPSCRRECSGTRFIGVLCYYRPPEFCATSHRHSVVLWRWPTPLGPPPGDMPGRLWCTGRLTVRNKT